MSVSKLPSGRYRAQVYDPSTGKTLSAGKVLGLLDPTFPSRSAGRAAVVDARRRLQMLSGRTEVTVAGFRERWLSDPLFQRPKRSTMIAYAHRTRAFAAQHGTLRLDEVDRRIVGQWLMGGRSAWTIPGLRAMFQDAINPGLLLESNPFSRLGLRSTGGNRFKEPPSDEMAGRLLSLAWEGVDEQGHRLAPDSFAAWLQVAMSTGMRGGELDALAPQAVDLDAGLIEVRRSFSARSRQFTLPKNGRTRKVAILPPAREALERVAWGGEFVFTHDRGGHWSEQARRWWWDRVRLRAGWEGSLYLATRHYAAHYLYEVCGLAAEDVAVQLGQLDGGELVRLTYGHHSAERALDRVKLAASGGRELRAVEDVA